MRWRKRTVANDKPCPHPSFQVTAQVHRVEILGAMTYRCDLTAVCAACGLPFRWLGVEGVDTHGLRARMALAPGMVAK